MARSRKKKQVTVQGTTTSEAVGTVEGEAIAMPVALDWLTLERALYALLVMAAAGLRLGDLGHWPLAGFEASTALDAWHFLQGAGGSVIGHSPLLFHGDVLTFALFGSGDAQTRIVSVLFGTLLVALPYTLRELLGRSGALMTALFMTISPTMLFFSRQGTPAVLAAACALTLLAGAAHFAQSGDRRGLYLAAGAFGLGLTSGPSFYTHIFLWGLFVLAVVGAQRRQSGDDVAFPNLPDQETFVRLLIVAVATFGIAATGFLLDWAGLQGAVGLAGAWFDGVWHIPGGLLDWTHYLSLLALYEPAALLFGVAGVLLFAREKGRTVAFAVTWFVGGLLIYGVLDEAVSPSNLVAILLPLILLAGAAAGRLLDELALYGSWEVEGAYLALASPIVVFVVFNLARYANTGTDRFLGLAIIGFSAVMLAVAAIGYWAGIENGMRAGGLIALVFLSLSTFGSAWNLSLERADNPAEPMIVEATSPDIRHLPETIANLSNERLRERDAMAVTYDRELGPLVGWYLRGFRDVRVSSQPAGPDLTPAVIVPYSPEPPALGKDYIGQRFHLQRLWNNPGLSGSKRARWLLYRNVTDGYVDVDAILYVQVPRSP